MAACLAMRFGRLGSPRIQYKRYWFVMCCRWCVRILSVLVGVLGLWQSRQLQNPIREPPVRERPVRGRRLVRVLIRWSWRGGRWWSWLGR